MPAGACRRAAAGVIVLGVAAIHLFRVGHYLDGIGYRLYYSYASDLLVPLAMYFVLCLSEGRGGFVSEWRARACAVLGAACTAEILQGLGVPMLGRTFDPLDFAMYGVGVLLAVLLDRLALPVVCGLRNARRGETG